MMKAMGSRVGGEFSKRTFDELVEPRSVPRLVPIVAVADTPPVKRAMDMILSIVIALVLTPVLLLIALAIKLDSRGPVLFRQTRTGAGGQTFEMYKFRTMVSGADSIKPALAHMNDTGDPRLFKIRNDPRITRVGRFLRRSSLDELPQIINVLAGEMSLIGPRPFFPEDLDHYSSHHLERLTVLPGITGLWQVSGRSSVLDFEEVVRIDRAYISGWSMLLDLKILALTVPAVLRRQGAY
jgi:lipopolysaccharide/colanic/teichoic acid biosynthesis glycosyltransferase